MKNPLSLRTLLFVVLLSLSAICQPLRAQTSAGEFERKVQSMLDKMTVEQKLKLVGGNGMYTFAIPETGLPAIKMSDDPSGVRSWGPSTAYPVGIALAATWDTAMASAVGASLAQDAKARSVNILLAPGVNLYRAPMNGRNFEYFGEDPFLASRIAVGYIAGIQSKGVAATVKHFDANNSEFDRHNINAIIDERTLHELYLPAFESAVREAHVSAVMDAYNLVNGQHATQNAALNNQILKADWHFDGLLMSDWEATYDGIAAANAGLDLEMPRAKAMAPATLAAAIQQGQLNLSTLDDHVRRILRLAVRYGLTGPQRPTPAPLVQDRPAARAIAYKEAAESIVLLRNERNLLPLFAAKLHRLALIGPNVIPAVTGGGGSSYTTAVASTNLHDALASAAPNLQLVTSPGLLTEKQICSQTVFDDGIDQQQFASSGFTGSIKRTHLATLDQWQPTFRI